MPRVKIVYDDGRHLPSKVFTCSRYDAKTGHRLGGDDDEMDQVDGNHNHKHNNHVVPPAPPAVSLNELTIKEIKPFDQFNEEALARHNYLRSLHGCPPLKLNHDLAKGCQAYAEELAKKGKMVHSEGDYGENLAYREHSTQAYHSGRLASNHWYSEIKDYDFDGDEQLNCGHFSQLVWKDCTEAGFGVALSADKKKAFVVGRYLPPGNWRGKWKENIPRPTSGQVYIPTNEDLGK